MKTRTIIGNIIIASSLVLGSAQAGNMHPDEVFRLINSVDSNSIEAGASSGDCNSIKPLDTVEFSKLELSDADSGNQLRRKQSISDFIHYLTTY